MNTPLTPIDAAYEAGWIEAAKWAERADLIADIGSGAYERDKAAALAAATPQAEPVRESTEEVRVWHEGPPPHVGWWECGIRMWRWWSGEWWGCLTLPAHSQEEVGCAARIPTMVGHIKWCDYYPENARVPRINPAAIAATKGQSND